MSFLTLGALLVALLVGAPIAAHLLRRKQAEERPFPPARLVPPTPPLARKRSALEDRALFAIRAIAVVALAILGATPFVRCSRLTIARRGGASVALAIVIDDSLSMRAVPAAANGRAGKSRFDRALSAARELVDGARTGDAVAIVLAGAPARVALAATTNMSAVTAALDAVEPSDRATDLDGALRVARELVKGLPQVDKRVVVLSDLADGAADSAPITSEGDVATWVPIADLAADGSDCAVTRADRNGAKVTARVVCTHAGPAGGPDPVTSVSAVTPASPATGPWAERSLEVRSGARVLGSEKLPPTAHATEVTIPLPGDAPELLRAVLTGSDSIAADDEAPVIAAGGSLMVAVVADATTHVETGGPPPIEQAFAALELDVQVRPLPGVPEHPDELKPFAAMVVDDVPGFTPEVRRAIAAWVERGGVVLLTLGTRAAAAPLGAGFEPLVPGVVRWAASAAAGADPKTAPTLGSSAEGLEDLRPRGRAVLEAGAAEGADVLARWKDGAPLLIRRSLGRGAVLILTLPFSTEESDIALRPAFLALVDRFVGTARARGGARRIEVGEAWTFDGMKQVAVRRVALTPGTEPRPLPIVDADGRMRATPALAGLYELTLDGDVTVRVAGVPEREIDLRPRRVLAAARAESLGGISPSLDASPYVALLLLALLAAELLLRTIGFRKVKDAEVLASGAS